MSRKLPDIFANRVVVIGGAMGSLLVQRGVDHAHPYEELNLSAPYLICQAHADYIKAGADVLMTQPVFDIDSLRAAAKLIPDDWRPPILVRIARDIYLAAKREFGGVYFMPPFEKYEVALQVLRGE